MAALATTLARVGRLYGECAVRHAAVVNSYQAARAAIAAWQAQSADPPRGTKINLSH